MNGEASDATTEANGLQQQEIGPSGASLLNEIARSSSRPPQEQINGTNGDALVNTPTQEQTTKGIDTTENDIVVGTPIVDETLNSDDFELARAAIAQAQSSAMKAREEPPQPTISIQSPDSATTTAKRRKKRKSIGQQRRRKQRPSNESTSTMEGDDEQVAPAAANQNGTSLIGGKSMQKAEPSMLATAETAPSSASLMQDALETFEETTGEAEDLPQQTSEISEMHDETVADAANDEESPLPPSAEDAEPMKSTASKRRRKRKSIGQKRRKSRTTTATNSQPQEDVEEEAGEGEEEAAEEEERPESEKATPVREESEDAEHTETESPSLLRQRRMKKAVPRKVVRTTEPAVSQKLDTRRSRSSDAASEVSDSEAEAPQASPVRKTAKKTKPSQPKQKKSRGPRPRRGSQEGSPVSQASQTSKPRVERRPMVPILVRRLTNLSALAPVTTKRRHEDDANDEAAESGEDGALVSSDDELGSRAKYPSRNGANPADVLAQFARESIASTLASIIGRIESLDAENAAAEGVDPATIKRDRRDWTLKHKAVEAYGEELETRLNEISDALEYNWVLDRRVKGVRVKEKQLRDRWTEVRQERERIARRMDAVRRKVWREREWDERHADLNRTIHDVELQLSRKKQGGDEEDGGKVTDGLDFLLQQMAETVGADGPGVLDEVKGFNRLLEQTVEALDGR